MAEGFREWGDYGEQERWQNKTTAQKIFSLRALKLVIKIVCVAVIVGIYGILAYRLATGLNAPKKATGMLWTEKATAAYESSGGKLIVYTEEQDDTLGKDGRFAVYGVKLIPEINEVQLTVRYNHSTVKALREETEKKYEDEAERTAALEEIDDSPFVFILRDDKNNVYTSYSYSGYIDEGLYTYVTLAFDDVKLFNTETAPKSDGYFSPDSEYSRIIYKGQNKSVAVSSDISYIYIDFYYENDVKYNGKSWGAPILIYRNNSEMKIYDLGNDAPSDITTSGIKRYRVEETNN